MTAFPDGKRKDFWWAISGAAVFFGLLVFWFIDGTLNRDKPTDEERQKAMASDLEELKLRLNATEKRIINESQRTLSETHKTEIISVASQFRGQKFRIFSLLFDPESHRYAQGFMEALSNAGWDSGLIAVGQSTFSPNFYNVAVALNPDDRKTDNTAAGTALAMKLLELGLTKESIIVDPAADVRAGEVKLFVGMRPS